MTDKPDKPLYDVSRFDAGYYGGGSHGGFGPEIEWDSRAQQDELLKKFNYLGKDKYHSILFVGCARGAEVRLFCDKGKDARGVEVSKWAVDNVYPEVKDRVLLYPGSDLKMFGDKQFDVVASFDVFALLPPGLIQSLAKEINRVCKSLILIRCSVKNWRNLRDAVDGEDGVSFRLPEVYFIDKAFSESGEFALEQVIVHWNYEGLFRFTRK